MFFDDPCHHQLLHDVESYHIETSLLICRANQWTCFYKIGTSVMKELKFYESPTILKSSAI